MVPKHLDGICWRLSTRLLGEPGTFVEKMKGCNVGKIYEVTGKIGISLTLKNEDRCYADYFRKVSP